MRTDEKIKRDLIDELFWDYRVDASNVKAEVSHGLVILTGTVPSQTARRAAIDAAWVIDGVRDVISLLTVRFPMSSVVPSDAEIKTSANGVLAWNPDLYNIDIDVNVSDGIVTLEGSVDTYGRRWKAEDLVSNLRGVIDVKNLLTIVPSKKILDKDIAQVIEAELKRNKYINAEDITVKVNDGNVTLVGTAPSHYAKARAYDAAAFTPGVLKIDNSIAIT